MHDVVVGPRSSSHLFFSYQTPCSLRRQRQKPAAWKVNKELELVRTCVRTCLLKSLFTSGNRRGSVVASNLSNEAIKRLRSSSWRMAWLKIRVEFLLRNFAHNANLAAEFILRFTGERGKIIIFSSTFICVGELDLCDVAKWIFLRRIFTYALDSKMKIDTHTKILFF